MKRRYAIAATAALLAGAGLFATTGSASATSYTYYVVDSGGQSVAASGGNSGQVYATCTSGDYATGGGLLVSVVSDSQYDEVTMSQSFPVYSGTTATGWAASATNNESAARTIHVYANCVHETP